MVTALLGGARIQVRLNVHHHNMLEKAGQEGGRTGSYRAQLQLLKVDPPLCTSFSSSTKWVVN